MNFKFQILIAISRSMFHDLRIVDSVSTRKRSLPSETVLATEMGKDGRVPNLFWVTINSVVRFSGVCWLRSKARLIKLD